MREDHLWNRARNITIQTSPEIVGNFDISFDSKIPEQTKDALMQFVYWVEDHFHLPVTLWVDFKYNHYLIDRKGKRVGYRFYWAEFSPYPVLEKEEDIPVIELSVRTEHWSMVEILTSFIEAISMYYLWLTNVITETNEPNAEEVEEVLQAYLRSQ